MRRILAAASMVVLLGAAACLPSEKPMTVTDGPMQPACLNNGAEGTIEPIGATPKVVLQRTVGGKWVDWKWYEAGMDSEKPHVLSAAPSKFDGSYVIKYSDRKPDGTKLSGVIHLRVRSNGGGYTGKGFYVKFPKVCS